MNLGDVIESASMVQTLTARERWYRLHRARRVFRREQIKTLRVLLTQNAPSKHLLEMSEKFVNPVILIDPSLLRDGWI